MTCRAPDAGIESFAPRLLTDAQAAAYLNLPLRALARIVRGRVLICGKARWDRLALDAWLDEQSGLTPKVERANASDADAAFDQWAKDTGHAAGAA